jgi:hypothetical protein
MHVTHTLYAKRWPSNATFTLLFKLSNTSLLFFTSTKHRSFISSGSNDCLVCKTHPSPNCKIPAKEKQHTHITRHIGWLQPKAGIVHLLISGAAYHCSPPSLNHNGSIRVNRIFQTNHKQVMWERRGLPSGKFALRCSLSKGGSGVGASNSSAVRFEFT